MNEKKVEYLKRNLEEALKKQNFSEINNYYQELLKLVDVSEIPELSQQVSQYNQSYADQFNKEKDAKEQALKTRIRKAKKRYESNVNTRRFGFIGGFLAMIFGFMLVLHGTGAFGSYDDFIMYFGLFIFIASIVLIIIGTICAARASGLEINVTQCRKDIFAYICEQETKLQYLPNVETTEENYVGQLKGADQHGFGVCLRNDTTIYAGQWVDGWPSGVGKLYSDDLSMILEGEFYDDELHGIVDIQWEDGAQWHGEYRNGMPWDGSGKAFVNYSAQYGTWKDGSLISQ